MLELQQILFPMAFSEYIHLSFLLLLALKFVSHILWNGITHTHTHSLAYFSVGNYTHENVEKLPCVRDERRYFLKNI